MKVPVWSFGSGCGDSRRRGMGRGEKDVVYVTGRFVGDIVCVYGSC